MLHCLIQIILQNISSSKSENTSQIILPLWLVRQLSSCQLCQVESSILNPSTTSGVSNLSCCEEIYVSLPLFIYIVMSHSIPGHQHQIGDIQALLIVSSQHRGRSLNIRRTDITECMSSRLIYIYCTPSY